MRENLKFTSQADRQPKVSGLLVLAKGAAVAHSCRLAQPPC